MSALAHEVSRLSRSLHALKTRFAARHGDSGSWSSYALLSQLVRTGPQRPSALADAVHADPSTMSRQVADLLRLGLGERRTDPADGRAWLVEVTPAGQRAFTSMCEQRDAMFATLVADWDPGDVRRLGDLLGRLNDGLGGDRTDLDHSSSARTPPPEGPA